MQKLIATSYMFGGKNYDNKEGQSIIWERGVVFCQGCWFMFCVRNNTGVEIFDCTIYSESMYGKRRLK